MCGITGIVGHALPRDETLGLLGRMLKMIQHRGPDEQSTWIDDRHRCGLAHSRLSIIDLEMGSQPISNEAGTITVIFNGEIYNYRELRQDLIQKGYHFRTSSDTEVLVHLYNEFGITMGKYLRGMFAIAIWDHREAALHLIRDPLGKKPLYTLQINNRLYFSSEYKAFLRIDGFRPALDAQSLHYLLNLRWLPQGACLMESVEQVPPGHTLTYVNDTIHKTQYWTFNFDQMHQGRVQDHEENILALLKQAVSRRLVADVPVGLFLSGGLDSSAILALMAEQMDIPVKSYCLGFNNKQDETLAALETANYFSADHKNYQIEKNPLDSFMDTIWHAEVPKVNAIQMYLLAQKASQDVKVVLTGLGGDELFGGYDNYLYVKYGGFLADIPLPRVGDALRDILFKLQRGGKNLQWDTLRRGLQMGCAFGRRNVFYSILRNVWDVDSDMYQNVYHPSLVKKQRDFSTADIFSSYMKPGGSFLEQVMTCELQQKLGGDQILIEDRTLMAHGLEGRAPFLDVDLIDYSMRIPASMKIKLFKGRKHILDKALRKTLPAFVFDRKKQGFGFNPLQEFKNNLGPAVKLYLTRERVESQQLFNYEYINRILTTPASRQLEWHYWLIWTILGVSMWHERFVEQQ